MKNENRLTGKRRFRSGAFGKVILQVEVEKVHRSAPDPYMMSDSPWDGTLYTEWRDARIEDVTEEENGSKSL